MNYFNLKIAYHVRQADLKYRRALEYMLNGNVPKSEHYMRLAHGHIKNAEFYTKKANAALFLVQG